MENKSFSLVLRFLKQRLNGAVATTSKNGHCILIRLFNEMFLICRVPTLRGQQVVKHGGYHGVSNCVY